MDKLNNKEKTILDEFFTDNHSLFVAASKKIVGNTEAAEEVVQKTSLYIIQKVTEDKEIRNLTGYMIVAIRSRSINYRRDIRKVKSLTDFDINSNKIRKKF